MKCAMFPQGCEVISLNSPYSYYEFIYFFPNLILYRVCCTYASKQAGSFSIEARKIRQSQQRTAIKDQKLSHTKIECLIWKSLDELLKHHTWLRTRTEQRANHSSLLRNYFEHNPFDNVTIIKIISSELVFYIPVIQLAKDSFKADSKN